METGSFILPGASPNSTSIKDFASCTFHTNNFLFFHKDVVVVSPAFAVELGGREGVAFMSKVEEEAITIVGKYSSKTELTKSLEI